MELASLATTDVLLVLLAFLALGLLPAVVDAISRSPRVGRVDVWLDRALGGEREVQP